VRFEYNCKEERFRVMTVSTHSEPMADGETLTNWTAVDTWGDVAPGTAAETIMKTVCAK
jgi:hypothetical protein